MAHPSENHLAPYAVHSDDAGGRIHEEPGCGSRVLRNAFELDRHRIIESTAFRRLEHKTQVFAAAHHDHFRTRLTHSLEAAEVARCLAARLHGNELLAEAITLAHDLGHPPFGHAGEVALNELMAGLGGFNHNAHSLRVVDYLEHPFPPFRGLNLTSGTRAGLMTHATRYDRPGGGNLPENPSVEAQIASLADRIAYNCHDLEDAIGAEFVTREELAKVRLWHNAYEKAAETYDLTHVFAVRRAVLDTLLDSLLIDVIETSRDLLADMESLAAVRSAADPLVRLSADGERLLVELEDFLIERVYRHPEVREMDARGRRMVLALFDAYRIRPDALPQRFAARVDEQGVDRVICDYIAGMTDRFCTAEHDRMVGGASPGRSDG